VNVTTRSAEGVHLVKRWDEEMIVGIDKFLFVAESRQRRCQCNVGWQTIPDARTGYRESLSANCYSLNGGTTRRLVSAELRDYRPGRLATRTTGPRYCGAIPCITLNVSTAILLTRFGMHSQCRLTSASVTWSKRQSWQINHAAAFCTNWRRRTRCIGRPIGTLFP